jgi:plastocyanin
MRRALILFVIAMAWPGVAAAADQSVNVEDDFYSPSNVTVLKGDTVTWTQMGTNAHNVHLDSGEKLGGDPLTHSPSSSPWSDSFTFNTVGTFNYFCDEHSDIGMIGKVVVKDPNAPPPDTTPPKITDLKAKPSPFCTNKSETCDKRGTRVSYRLSERAKVTADIQAKNGNTGPVSIFVNKKRSKGGHSFKFSGKGLKPGKYTLRLRAHDAAGNTSKPAKKQVKVAKNG